MKQQEQEKPARVRLESYMQHGLNIPLPGPGKSIRGYVRIPAALGDKPGSVETDELDAVTLNRLRYHYEWRPTDPKLLGKRRSELASEQIVDIGLLKITVLPAESKPTEGKQTKAA